MTAEKRKLIINADDFGSAEEANTAIAELYTAGKITSTSLLAVGAHFDHAAELAAKHGIQVGVHWALNSDYQNELWRPVLGENVKSLTDEDGNFYCAVKQLAKHAKSKEVTAECRAQVEKIIAAGIQIDHADSHCGTLYGIIGRLFYFNAFKLCAEYDLPFRLPSRPDFLKMYLGDKPIPAPIRAVFRMVLSPAKRRGVKLIDHMAANTLDANEIESYRAYEERCLAQIRAMPVGVSEFFAHPAYDCPRLNKKGQWKVRLYDLEFLHSEALRQTILDEGIELVSYGILKE